MDQQLDRTISTLGQGSVLHRRFNPRFSRGGRSGSVDRLGFPRWACLLLFLLLFLFLLTWSGGSANGQLPADRSATAYLEELEQQQLFGSIIRHCEQKFSEPDVPSGLKSELAARWIRSLTLRTLNLEPQAAASVWPEVRATAARLVAETQFFPQHSLVRFQAGLIGLGEARLASLSPAISAERTELRAKGIEAARQAYRDLQSFHQEIMQRAPGVPERATTNDTYPELTRQQLYALARDVEYQMLLALAVRTRFYADNDSASRLDTAQQVLELASTLQPKVSNESILWWETQYQVLEALRGLKDWGNWDIKWQNSPLALAPEQVLGKLTSSRIEMLLDQANYREALSQANDFFVLLQKRDPTSLREVKNTADLSRVTAWPEFDLVRARLYLLLAIEADRLASEKAGERVDVARVGAEAQTLEFSRYVGKQHGSFWSGELNRRLLSGSAAVATDRTAPVSVLLIRQLMTEGQWEQVRDLIRTGVQQAIQSENVVLAMDLATLVAGIPTQIPPQPWMVEQIESVALGFPQHPRAAGTHHYANIIANKLAETQPSYRTNALAVWQRHATTWPTAETAHKIRLQIAAHFSKQEDYESAATTLLAVALDSPSHPLASRQLVGVMSSLLLDKKLDAATRADVAQRWVKEIRPLLQEDGQWLTPATVGSNRLAVVLIQLQLETTDAQASWIGPLIQLIEQQANDLDASLRSQLATVAALAEYHQVSGGTQAMERLAELGSAVAVADLVWLAQALERRLPKLGLMGELELAGNTANRSGMVRRAAALQLAVVESLKTHHPQAVEKYRGWLLQQEITALLYSERIAEAITAARSAAENNDKSLAHQQWLGYSLARSNHPEDSAAAVDQWRKIGFLTQKNSDPWFESRYYLAESQRRLGQKQEAAKLLKFLKATEGQAWENSPFRDQLDRLLKSIAATP